MKKLIISLICTASLLTAATTANAAKFGFGFDQGFGLAGQLDNVNAFIGNDGISADYIFEQGSFRNDIPFNYYVGAGAFVDWDGDELGVRVPLGVTFPFAAKWDLYGQVSPHLAHRDKQDDVKFGASAAVGVRYEF
ncbi:hypothetical protein [Psychromonas sp.]|uniref:hypothetical protein n=1 Tax=Psychromonas sp. TaxID=1884585 RepID=UPI0035613EF1